METKGKTLVDQEGTMGKHEGKGRRKAHISTHTSCTTVHRRGNMGMQRQKGSGKPKVPPAKGLSTFQWP